MHYQLDPSIKRLVVEQIENSRRLNRKHVRNLSAAKNIHLLGQKDAVTYYFDYNTVEIILIGCNIFLALVAIMFESGRFYYTDPETGIQTLDSDPTSQVFYNTVLVFAGLTLVGSLVYYSIVFIAEVLGKLPNLCKKCLGDKKRRQLSSFGNDDSFVMESNPFAGGQIQKIKDIQNEEDKLNKDIEAMTEQKRQILETQNALKEQNKRMKRDLMANNQTKPTNRTPRKKKKKEEGAAFGQKRVDNE